MEIWKDIEGYEGYYQVSNEGRVKCLERYVESVSHGKPCLRHLKEKIMTPVRHKKYIYKHVQLGKDGIKETYKVHRLVWEAFNGEIPEGMEIDHINTIRDDNRLENLRCVTPKENRNNPLTKIHQSEAQTGKHKGNLNYMYGKHHTDMSKDKIRCKAIGRKHSQEAKKKMSDKRKGELNPMYGKERLDVAKRLSKKVLEVKNNGDKKEWNSIAEICRFYNWNSSGNISDCCNGKYIREGNHSFKGSDWYFIDSF